MVRDAMLRGLNMALPELHMFASLLQFKSGLRFLSDLSIVPFSRLGHSYQRTNIGGIIEALSHEKTTPVCMKGDVRGLTWGCALSAQLISF